MRVVLGIVAILILLAVGALAWVYSGGIDVAASSREPPALRWLVDTAMRQSVRAHAREIQPPALGDSVMVEEGAKLFQGHCVQCHGAPGIDPREFARAMRPSPPKLSEAVGEWTSAELFWIIKNGVKMTGMPAWGATHVDAEIWSLVAFLGQLPTMPAERYQAIVQPPPPEPAHPHAEEQVPPPEGEEEPSPPPLDEQPPPPPAEQ